MTGLLRRSRQATKIRNPAVAVRGLAGLGSPIRDERTAWETFVKEVAVETDIPTHPAGSGTSNKVPQKGALPKTQA
jgi:hypothetical protein